jgi:hypothetical protein
LEETTQKDSDGKKITLERSSPVISDINLSPTQINKARPRFTTMELNLAKKVIFVVVNTKDSGNG